MTDKAISPLRQRLIEDMAIRRLGPGPQHQYPPRQKVCRFSRAESGSSGWQADLRGTRVSGEVAPKMAPLGTRVCSLSRWQPDQRRDLRH